jgi:hypothetical protein
VAVLPGWCQANDDEASFKKTIFISHFWNDKLISYVLMRGGGGADLTTPKVNSGYRKLKNVEKRLTMRSGREIK